MEGTRSTAWLRRRPGHPGGPNDVSAPRTRPVTRRTPAEQPSGRRKPTPIARTWPTLRVASPRPRVLPACTTGRGTPQEHRTPAGRPPDRPKPLAYHSAMVPCPMTRPCDASTRSTRQKTCSCRRTRLLPCWGAQGPRRRGEAQPRVGHVLRRAGCILARRERTGWRTAGGCGRRGPWCRAWYVVQVIGQTTGPSGRSVT